MKIIDLTHTISIGLPVYPGDLPVQLTKNKELLQDGYNNFLLSTGMHIGTHLDGPMHLTSDSRFISEIDPEKFTGKGVLINVEGQKRITLRHLAGIEIEQDQIVLFYSGFDKYFSEEFYFTDHPVFEEEVVRFLVTRKIKMIGIDWPSPDNEPYPLHEILLKNEILILENLKNLNLLMDHSFEVFAFPLKINADSSPVRAVAGILD